MWYHPRTRNIYIYLPEMTGAVGINGRVGIKLGRCIVSRHPQGDYVSGCTITWGLHLSSENVLASPPSFLEMLKEYMNDTC